MTTRDLNKVKVKLTALVDERAAMLQVQLDKISFDEPDKRMFFGGQITALNDIKRDINRMTVKHLIIV